MTNIQERMQLVGRINVQLNTTFTDLAVAESKGDLPKVVILRSEMDSLYALKDVINTLFHKNTEVTL